MKKLIAFLGFLLIIGLVGQASALTIGNPSFEDATSGVLDVWTKTGSGDVQQKDELKTADFDFTPRDYDPQQGSYFARLLADEGSTGTTTIKNTTLTWNAGETIAFDWAFSNLDSTGDYGEYKIYAGNSTLNTLLFSGTIEISADPTGYVNEWLGTDWTPVSNTFGSTGSGWIEFTLHDANTVGQSQLLIDDVRLSAVPEPATMLLLGFGLIGIAGVGRKNRE